MKEYIDQIYNESLGKQVYIPLKRCIDKSIKSKELNKVLNVILKVVWTIIAFFLAFLLCYVTFPL